MEELSEALSARVAEALAASPDADPVAVGALLIAEIDPADSLAAQFAAFSEHTRALVVAHGEWPQFDRRATELTEVQDGAAALGLVELRRGGWLDAQDTFPLVVRAWRRARLRPPVAVVRRAADRTEQAFHRWRCAGAGDVEARAALDRWSTWSRVPEVAQWGSIAREEPLSRPVCARCEAWAAIEESRAAQWRGWEDQARRSLDRAEAVARSDRARFFVKFLRAIRAVAATSEAAGDLVRELAEDVPAEEEWVFVHQVEAVQAQTLGRDPRPPLHVAVGLAQRLSFPFREAHVRLLLALVEWPDGRRMREALEAIDLTGVQLSDRDRWNLQWAWARAALASDDLEAAGRHSRGLLEDEALAKLNPGAPWAVVALAERQAGNLAAAREAQVQAHRFLTRDGSQAIQTWFERAWRDGSHRPLPDLTLGGAQPTAWVLVDGTRFRVGGVEVHLERSPVSVALLRALASGPQDSDALIEAAWPGDAASYPSLRNRLHSALRTLRRRGLGEHLVFEGEVYRLEGLDRVHSVGD